MATAVASSSEPMIEDDDMGRNIVESSFDDEIDTIYLTDEDKRLEAREGAQARSNDVIGDKCVDLLERAYEQRDFKLIDEIIEDIIHHSSIGGLRKIHIACGYGFSDLVAKYLRDDKEDANCECSFNDLSSITPIHFCAGIGPDQIAAGRAECIQLLVEHGVRIDHLTSRKDSALHWATKLADASVCRKLIDCGIDLTILNTDNCTPAHGAAFYKRLDIIEMLLDANMRVNVRDASGKSILHLLCKTSVDEEDEERLSRSRGADKDKTTVSTTAASTTAATNKKKRLLSIIQRLLTHFQLDPNETDADDFTPLMYTCSYDDSLEMVKLLVEHGANIKHMNKDEVTCMLLAVVNSCPSIVKYLIEQGFDVTHVQGDKVSYLTDAAYLNDIEIVNMLIDAGCDVNETKFDESGVILNPLWAACERSNLIVVETLLAHGANTLIKSDLKITALHCNAMAQYECVSIAKMLVDYKCPLNMKSAQADETPAFLATNSGFKELLEFLLDLGVDVNDCSPPHRTCFQQAIFRGHKEILALLVRRGYVLKEEDKSDLKVYAMDLYQERDVQSLRFLLGAELISKPQLLECIARVHEWMLRAAMEEKEAKSERGEQKIDEDSSEFLAAKLTDLSLEKSGAQDASSVAEKLSEATYPKTIEELDAFLDSRERDESHSSSEELKNL